MQTSSNTFLSNAQHVSKIARDCSAFRACQLHCSVGFRGSWIQYLGESNLIRPAPVCLCFVAFFGRVKQQKNGLHIGSRRTLTRTLHATSRVKNNWSVANSHALHRHRVLASVKVRLCGVQPLSASPVHIFWPYKTTHPFKKKN